MSIVSEIKLKDSYSSVANRVGSSIKRLSSQINSATRDTNKFKSSLSNAFGKTHTLKIKDVKSKEIRRNLQSLQSELRKTTDKAHTVDIKVKTGFKSSLKSAFSGIKKSAKGAVVNVKGIAKARREARKLSKELKKSTGKKHKVSIRVDGKGMGILGRIKNGLRGIIGKHKVGIGGGGGSPGGGSMFKSMLGANLVGGAISKGIGLATEGIKSIFTSGADLEEQKVSMQHFLGGDKVKTESYVSSLRKEANKTPFETGEVIAAGTRAVQITEGDTKKGMELVKMAEDMAALTPGKTISDAMEALADMKMGEMERMKEFGFKGTKENFDAAGGDITKMKSTSGKTIGDLFKGGAEKLSGTSKGRLSTIKGNIASGMADAGVKLLEKLSPSLEKLIPVSERVAKAIGDKLPQVFDQVQSFVMPRVESLMGTIKPVFESLKPKIEGLINAIGPAIMGIVDMIVPVFNFLAPIMTGLGEIVLSFLTPIIETIGNVINDFIIPALTTIEPIVTAVMTVVGDLLQPAFETVGEYVGGALYGAFTLIKGAVDVVAGALEWLGSVAQSAADFLGGIGDFVGGIFGGGKKKGNANGTTYFSGGITAINERGEEMIQLAKGDKVYPHGETKKIIKSDLAKSKDKGNTSNVTNNYNITVNGGDAKENAKEVEKIIKRLAVNKG